jgi:hypothetical protein
LPRNKTPFEVWFNRKPHWIIEPQLSQAETGFYNPNDKDGQDSQGDDNNEISDQDFNDEDQGDDNRLDLVLSEIETRVAANNARLHALMIRANSSRSPLFIEG